MWSDFVEEVAVSLALLQMVFNFIKLAACHGSRGPKPLDLSNLRGEAVTSQPGAILGLARG